MERLSTRLWQHASEALGNIGLFATVAVRGYARYPTIDDIPAEDVEAVQRFRTKFTRTTIPYKQFTVTFQRSSGAGGQNVNKVNTKVHMRFKLDDQSWIPRYIRQRMRELESARINSHGEYLLTSEKTRSQRHNIDDCLDKLWQHIERASALPKAPSAEMAQRVQKLQQAEKAHMAEIKKRRSQRKASRRKGFGDD
ncbi:hypothetical protein IWW36_003372 [Coemansia brasiliensis]|uniref:Prokaryotic-type class I peptide chain release factors domain-containing protein n=1 Tax=Coemansia brasiliensis TaxID=2650707 RepID=A0A9W8M054_9FUNG|nr:hypothetical protein IWW36_003372 [Coemansia brasiliensis]